MLCGILGRPSGRGQLYFCGSLRFGLRKSFFRGIERLFHDEPAHADSGCGGGLLNAVFFFFAHPEGDLFREAFFRPPRTGDAEGNLSGLRLFCFHDGLRSPLEQAVKNRGILLRSNPSTLA